MSLGDKMKNAMEDNKGKAKEAAGRATGDDALERQGQTDQAKANVKKAAEKAKDALKKD